MNLQLLFLDDDEFNELISTVVPVAWLQNWYRELLAENEDLHERIDEMIEEKYLAADTERVIDEQISCFNRSNVILNELLLRDGRGFVAIPDLNPDI